MAVKKDTVQVTLIIDGKKGINELGKLEMEANDLKHSLKELKRGTVEYAAANDRLTAVKAKVKALRDEMGLAGMTMKQLRAYQRELSTEMNNATTRGTAEYNKLKNKIREVNSAINSQQKDVKGLNTFWAGLSKEVKAFGLIALGYLGITTLTTQINNLIDRSAKLSDQLAGVQKTTGLLDQEVLQLAKDLQAIDTRTARGELLEMAKIAGKLGITGRDNVLGFVRAADQINVALGEDLGAPEETMRKLGKLVETFNVRQVYGIEESMVKVGSAINELGKSSTANEGYIVEFAKRMGGVAPLAKISIQDILGMAAASDALGLTSEVTTTALSKMFLKMTNEKELFVQYAKNIDGSQMSLGDFSKLIDTDFNSAFLALLRGVKDNSNGMNELAATLSDLELDGGRVIQVLGTLANNQDMLTRQQKISNREFAEGSSLMEEFTLMNETFGASLDKLMKRLAAVFVNNSLISGLQTMVEWMLRLTNTPLSERLIEEQTEVNTLAKAIMNANDNQRVRNGLIEEMRQKYPDFLKGLDAENLSNERLAEHLKKVNEQYYQKIIIAAAEEEITEMMREQVEIAKQQIQIEKEIAALDAKGTETYRPGAISSSAFADAKRAERVALESEYNLLMEMIAEKETEKATLLAKFGGSPFAAATGAGGVVNTGGEPVSSPTAGGGFNDAPELEAIAARLEMETATLMKGYKVQELTFEEFEKRKTEIAQQYAALREQIADEELQNNLSNAHNLFQALGGVFGSISDLQDENTKRGIEQQRKWANASVIASQTAAMASAIAGAAKAAEATGPAAIFTIAPFIATMLGTVLGAFAGIRANNRQAFSASAGLESNSSNTGSSGRSFFHGGETGNVTMGMGDKYGGYTGYTHADEYVVSHTARQTPTMMNAIAMDKMRANGVSMTGEPGRAGSGNGPRHSLEPGTTDGSSKAAERMEAAAARFEAWVDVLITNGVPTYFSGKAYDDGKEYYDKKETNRNRGRIG